MNGPQPKYPCNICGKLIGHAGFAIHAHHQMHIREAKRLADRLAEQEAGTCRGCNEMRVLSKYGLCFRCTEIEARIMSD